MTDVRQVLSDQQAELLHQIAQETGKTEDDLIREAVDQFIQQANLAERREQLRQARGMWRDRTDLPGLRGLRQEWERALPADSQPHG